MNNKETFFLNKHLPAIIAISLSGAWGNNATHGDVTILFSLETVPNGFGAATRTVGARGVATKFCLGGRIHRHPNPPTPKI